MSRDSNGDSPKNLSDSFIWEDNMKAYSALRCESCRASDLADPCRSCCGTGIEGIPLSEVMKVR